MMRLSSRAVLAGAIALAACAATTVVPRANSAVVERGHQIALDRCAGCHAVEPGKASPVPDAPEFSRLSQMWPIDQLDAGIRKGITAGHQQNPMPVLVLQPDELDDLIAYIRTIQLAKPN